MAQPPIRPDLPARFASFADFREGARRRIPHFAFEYLDGGIGRDIGLARNYAALDQVRITPRTTDDETKPRLAMELFGEEIAAPFGVAPLGMGGIFHPKAPRRWRSGRRR